MKSWTSALAAAALAFSAPAVAQDAAAETASIEAAAWLAGRWVGEGLGGELEETWAPPAGGQMVGHFRLVRDGAPTFYEIMVMDVVDGGLRLQVKHFGSDFAAWEEKDDWVVFEPVSAAEGALEFRGLSIRSTGPDTVEYSVDMRTRDGVRTETLRFRRAPL